MNLASELREAAHSIRVMRHGSQMDADLMANAADALEALEGKLTSALEELHHHFGCDPECEKRHP